MNKQQLIVVLLIVAIVISAVNLVVSLSLDSDEFADSNCVGAGCAQGVGSSSSSAVVGFEVVGGGA